MLPAAFDPTDWHVIVNRGKKSLEHVGNKRFRKHVNDLLPEYTNTSSRIDKAKCVSKVMGRIAQRCASSSPSNPSVLLGNDIGFVEKNTLACRWVIVPESVARRKVSQAFRDALKAQRAAEKKKDPFAVFYQSANNRFRSGFVTIRDDGLVGDSTIITSNRLGENNSLSDDHLVWADTDMLSVWPPEAMVSNEKQYSEANLSCGQQSSKRESQSALRRTSNLLDIGDKKRKRHSLVTGLIDNEHEPLPRDVNLDIIFSDQPYSSRSRFIFEHVE